MRQNRVSGFVRNDLPAEISMSNVGRNHMFQTLCQQSSATLTARKGGKRSLAACRTNDRYCCTDEWGHGFSLPRSSEPSILLAREIDVIVYRPLRRN